MAQDSVSSLSIKFYPITSNAITMRNGAVSPIWSDCLRRAREKDCHKYSYSSSASIWNCTMPRGISSTTFNTYKIWKHKPKIDSIMISSTIYYDFFSYIHPLGFQGQRRLNLQSQQVPSLPNRHPESSSRDINFHPGWHTAPTHSNNRDRNAGSYWVLGNKKSRASVPAGRLEYQHIRIRRCLDLWSKLQVTFTIRRSVLVLANNLWSTAHRYASYYFVSWKILIGECTCHSFRCQLCQLFCLWKNHSFEEFRSVVEDSGWG